MNRPRSIGSPPASSRSMVVDQGAAPERRRWLGATASLAALAALPFDRAAFAQAAWPSRPLRLIVPFPPGGTTDNVSRMVAAEISKPLGQTVVVDNKPGAGTVIGVEAAVRSAPDGYTVVCVANSFCANQTLVKRLPYDSRKDLTPVVLMGLSEHTLVTAPSSGLKTLADFTSRARQPDSKFTYASFGTGTSAHLAGEMLNMKLGTRLVHVPYKGQAPALADVMSGQVTVMFANWPEIRGQVQAGKLVALGMATEKRSVFAPQVPTLTEQGAAVVSNSWNGLLAPAGTPQPIVARINEEVRKALKSPQIADNFRQAGIVALAGSPEDFGRFIESEIVRYAEVIREARISIDT